MPLPACHPDLTASFVRTMQKQKVQRGRFFFLHASVLRGSITVYLSFAKSFVVILQCHICYDGSQSESTWALETATPAS